MSNKISNYSIAVIGGDGTGPEVISEAIKVLNAVGSDALSFTFTDLPYNGTRYLETKETLSDQECQALRNYDAILLGAIGHTDIKPGILERDILLKMRFDLDQYINLRPVKLYPNVDTPLKNVTPADIDYVVVRENTGGLYTGKGSCINKGTPDEVTTQVMEYSRHQVERCIRYAFKVAKKRKKEGKQGKVTLCGKTNVLTYVYDLWERTFHRPTISRY
jgi:3-isopropylmalate dehydrogenase